MTNTESKRTMTEFLNERFDEEVASRVDDDTTEEEAEQEVEQELEEATGRDDSTIDDILNGDIECPPLDPVVEGFAEVLGFAISDAIEAAPECNYGDDQSMTDTDESDEQSADTDEETTERQDAPEWAADLRELLESMNETLGDVAEAVRQDDDDEDDDDEEDNETDDDEDDEDEENSQESDVTADQREALETLRDGGFNVDDLDLNVDHDDDDENREADTADADPGDTYNKYGLKPT